MVSNAMHIIGQKQVGGYMRIGASSQDVPEHHMNKVMIASVVPQEYQQS
jgi:hypothetical protein